MKMLINETKMLDQELATLLQGAKESTMTTEYMTELVTIATLGHKLWQSGEGYNYFSDEEKESLEQTLIRDIGCGGDFEKMALWRGESAYENVTTHLSDDDLQRRSMMIKSLMA